MVEGVDYIVYVHRSTEIDDFKQFFNAQNTIVPGYSFNNEAEYKKNLEALLKFKVNDVTNFKNVVKAFPLEDRDQSYNNAVAAGDTSIIEKLYPGTMLFLPISRIGAKIASITLTGAQTDYYSFNTFFADKLKQLLQDPNYTPKVKFGKKGMIISQVSHAVSVWLIKKANPMSNSGGLKPEIIDITDSIMNVTTNVGSNGGNFTLTLSPAYMYPNTMVAYANTKDILKDKSAEIYRSISENDVIFIRFETLNNEQDRDLIVDNISESDLPNKIYDMIGLVDTVQEFYTPTGIDVMVQGRDLIKLLIDDENYFFPLLFAGGQDSSFNTQLKSEKMIKRIFATGKIENTFIYSMRSVEKTLLFIYSQLANLGVIPDGYDPFSSYIDEKGEDRRGYIVDVTEDLVVKREPANGLWQIMKIQIDNSVRDRYLADPSIARPDGSILSQIRKICQEPFVEFMSDTYGDMYYLIARKPPFDYKSVIDWVETPDLLITIEPEDIIDYTLNFETQAYTWFQITVNGAFIGGSKMALSYLPIVYFPELASIYGSRKYDIEHNYISYKSFFGHKGAESYGNVKREVIKDLLYVIESNIYLPFTRRGTITINGDRRIKRGTWIYNRISGEICYVDSVSNIAAISDTSVDRSTTLQVSRCMVVGFLEHYFNIFNTKTVQIELEKQLADGSGVDEFGNSMQDYSINITKSGIAKELLDFFLNRRQFYDKPKFNHL